jgi:hypothetical protein
MRPYGFDPSCKFLDKGNPFATSQTCLIVFFATQRDGCDMTGIKLKHGRKVPNKTPRDIIGTENITALKQAGFVVVRLSELSKLRAMVKSALDNLSSAMPQKDRP